jgi:hypothetical protein
MKVRAVIAGIIGAFEWRLAEGRGCVDGELLGKDEFSVAFEECWVEFRTIEYGEGVGLRYGDE